MKFLRRRRRWIYESVRGNVRVRVCKARQKDGIHYVAQLCVRKKWEWSEVGSLPIEHLSSIEYLLKQAEYRLHRM